MKHILIIHTGGTFGMVPRDPGQMLAPGDIQEHISRYVPELPQIAHIDFTMPFNIDSANMQPSHWQQLAVLISENVDAYDGFVVIHGTDSMSYTASALSFMLRNLPRPVILTGSQRPLAEIRTDARTNLIGAVELATYDIPEVCIFFGTELMRGNRAVKISSADYGAFYSPNLPPLATVGTDVKIHDHHLSPTGEFELLTGLSTRVVTFSFFPGMPVGQLHWLLDSDIVAIVIMALGMGNVATLPPSRLVPMTEQLSRAGKLVVVTSQCRHGRVVLSRYENGQMLKDAGAIGAGDMTMETATVKLMHLFGQEEADAEWAAHRLIEPIAGELTP